MAHKFGESGGIDAIIQSRRCPSVLIRESGPKNYSRKGRVPVDPRTHRGHTPESFENSVNRDWERKQKAARTDWKVNNRSSRKRGSGMKPLGSVSLAEFSALKRETGDPNVWRDPKAALKRIGRSYDID